VCYFSTFGPRFGLRQMVLSRYWFGWHGVKISEFQRFYEYAVISADA
jgi:purine-cytosine permease-like protein